MLISTSLRSLPHSCDRAHASIPLAQTPGGLTRRTWLQAGAQRAVIVVDPQLNSLGIDSRNDSFLSFQSVLVVYLVQSDFFLPHAYWECISFK